MVQNQAVAQHSDGTCPRCSGAPAPLTTLVELVLQRHGVQAGGGARGGLDDQPGELVGGIAAAGVGRGQVKLASTADSAMSGRTGSMRSTTCCRTRAAVHRHQPAPIFPDHMHWSHPKLRAAMLASTAKLTAATLDSSRSGSATAKRDRRAAAGGGALTAAANRRAAMNSCAAS